ncbi:Protein REVERSION-TO-ETHYLENE SENSITIVITY1 [Linum grandiflorum]
MDIKGASDIERMSLKSGMEHELWPLEEIDPKKARFPCCLVWTPLPVVSWLAPFMGHVGICREDGTILDFSGSNLVTVDNFAYGAAARFLQLDRDQATIQCCFPRNRAGHTCKHGFMHTENGSAITWDDALHASTRFYETKTYNIFTCNCHSFVANCLNRVCYGGSMNWNMLNVATLVLLKGNWIDWKSVVRSFLPFVVVLCLGVSLVGWPFIMGLLCFFLILIGWYVICTYCVKNLLEC